MQQDLLTILSADGRRELASLNLPISVHDYVTLGQIFRAIDFGAEGVPKDAEGFDDIDYDNIDGIDDIYDDAYIDYVFGLDFLTNPDCVHNDARGDYYHFGFTWEATNNQLANA